MFSEFLPQEIFGFLLVFVRLGSMIMVLPVLGESSIPPRIRLLLALSISLLIYGIVRDKLPAMPGQVFVLGTLIVFEAVLGVMIGTLIRLLVSALHTAGMIVAMQTGLATAQAFDPSQGSQSALMGSFLTLLGITLLFVTDIHHMMIAAMHDSYVLFPVGAEMHWGDFANMVTATVAASFKLGVQIATPFIVYGLIFNIGLGVLARLMPQLQVFFIAMPLNITMGFLILGIVMTAAMSWFVNHFEMSLGRLLQ